MVLTSNERETMIKHTIGIATYDDNDDLATQLERLADYVPSAWVRVIDAPWVGNDDYVIDVMLLRSADEALLGEWYAHDPEGFIAGRYSIERIELEN